MVAVNNVCLKCGFHIVHVLCSRLQHFVQRKNEVHERQGASLVRNRGFVTYFAQFRNFHFRGKAHVRRGRTV
jgi:hypothetical protein